MKHIVLACWLAAAPAAQERQDVRLELAAVIAVEEQERDLARAERLYREAIEKGRLSPAALAYTHLRLGNLLRGLGRDDEAKPFLEVASKTAGTLFEPAPPQGHDVEREKALREKARAIVRDVMQAKPRVTDWLDRLLWIGGPAVPEIIATLEGLPTASSYDPAIVTLLASVLWRIGGDDARRFLQDATRPTWVVALFAAGAGSARDPGMLAVARGYLDHPEWDVVHAVLRAAGDRFGAEDIVRVGEKGGAAAKKYVLEWARGASVEAALLPRLHRLVREGRASTDPELGRAAQGFLVTTASQQTLEGVELLLAELPRVSAPIHSPPRLQQPGQTASTLKRDDALRLFPAIDACAKALGRPEPAPAVTRWQWLAQLMRDVAPHLDASSTSVIFSWLDLGYDVVDALAGKLTPANAADVVARMGRLSRPSQEQLAYLLQDVELPPDLFPALREKVDEALASKAWSETEYGTRVFAQVIAATGHPDAAAWLRAARTKDTKIGWIALAAVKLAKRTRAEPVRELLRDVAASHGTEESGPAIAMLTLLAMGDEPALAIVRNDHQAARHPNATTPAGKKRQLTPLQYLIYRDPDPPHGYTDAQVISVLERLASTWIHEAWDSRALTLAAIPDRIVGTMAWLVVASPHSHGVNKHSWVQEVLLRLERGETTQGSDLRACVERLLQHEGTDVRVVVLQNSRPEDVARYRPLVEACLDVEDGECALLAARLLLAAPKPIAVEHLLGRKNRSVRVSALDHLAQRGDPAVAGMILPSTKDPEDEVRKTAASSLGALVSRDAVPALIEMLRDPNEQVRTRATEALTRIRFYHEQQAHWDRVLKGLDVTPASAAEKLLLQAKVGAPKPQRLLAIESLGTLGVPEALPFLIDWVNDADADIAAKAKAAITAIHMNPRK